MLEGGGGVAPDGEPALAGAFAERPVSREVVDPLVFGLVARLSECQPLVNLKGAEEVVHRGVAYALLAVDDWLPSVDGPEPLVSEHLLEDETGYRHESRRQVAHLRHRLTGAEHDVLLGPEQRRGVRDARAGDVDAPHPLLPLSRHPSH